MDIPKDKIKDIPILVFMLPSFITDKTGSKVIKIIDQLSSLYFVNFRENLDLLTCSTIITGWARSFCLN
jgi:hypothetical protein